MPQISASRRHGSRAAVFDFLPALARRTLASRIGKRSEIRLEGARGVFTLALVRTGHGAAESRECRIAQMRPEQDHYRLYWKRCTGRWTAYVGADGEFFGGSLRECLDEISRDPYGCFWP